MNEVLFSTCTLEEFLQSGRQMAKCIDRGLPLQEVHSRSFGDPVELLNVLTAERVQLFLVVRDHPGTVADIAERLDRDVSSVKADLDALVQIEIIEVDTTQVAHALFQSIRIEAVLA